VEAIGVLLRRLLGRLQVTDIQVSRPFLVKRHRVVKEGELERALHQAIRDREDARAVIVVLDADDDCPRELGPRLVARCQAATDLPASVVLANREFEAWFLGAKESLRGVRGIDQHAVAPPSPETIRDAKGTLSRNMVGRRYLETDDQAAFASQLDLNLAEQRSPSFAKLCRDVDLLVTAIRRS